MRASGVRGIEGNDGEEDEGEGDGEGEFLRIIPCHTYEDRFERSLIHSSSGKFGSKIICIKKSISNQK